MDHLPERTSQPREPSKRDLRLESFVELENHSQSKTDDAFQAWILSLFDWEIDGTCDPKRHTSPQISILLDKEEPLPDWQSQPGNFSRSSRGVLVDKEWNLQAQCQTLNGEYNYSAMSLKSIIMGFNGEFHWLDGTMRSPGCQMSDAIEWSLVSGNEVDTNSLHREEIGYWVLARCMDDHGESRTIALTLDDRISNDNGRLKLITPLGLLTIPLFTDYHVSTVAIAMTMSIQQKVPTGQIKDIELHVQRFVQSERFVQSLKQPLAESLDAKAATLISLMWIRFCRMYTVADLVRYRDICEAIRYRLRDKPPPSHELKLLLDHYREMHVGMIKEANGLVQGVEKTKHVFIMNEAIHILQMLQEVIAENDKWRPFVEQSLCRMFLFRYEAVSNREDLRTASALAETFCNTVAEDITHKPYALMILAQCRWEEDRLSGERKNRQAIVEALEEAESCSTGRLQQTVRQNLQTYNVDHFRTYETFDFSELFRELEVLKNAPADIAAEGEEIPVLEKIRYLRNRAQNLGFAYQVRPKDSSLIDEAIKCAERAFFLCKNAIVSYEVSDETYAGALTTYAQTLAVRFKISEASDDLYPIIQMYQEAVKNCRSTSYDRADMLHSLAQHQLLCHERKSGLERHRATKGSVDQTLIDAYENARAAYDSSSTESDAQAVYANTLIMTMVQRFGAAGDWSFLNEAIRVAQDSLTTPLRTDRTCIPLEATKCELLFQRFSLQRSTDSYDEAMDAARRYSERSPLETIDGPRQVIRLMSRVMEAFKTKANVLQEELPSEDVAFVRRQCDQILNSDRIQARHRIKAGLILGSLLSASKEWIKCNKAYENTISLINRLITRALSRDDREWLLEQFSTNLPTAASFTARYAAEATGSSVEVVTLSILQRLESSRGILVRLIFQSRLNLELFQSKDDNVAQEYDHLLRKLTLLEAVVSIDGNQFLNSNDNLDRIQRRAKIVERLSEIENGLDAQTEDISMNVLKSLVGKSAFVQVMASSDTTIALLVTGTELRMIELHELKALDILKNLDRLYGNSRLSKAKPTEVGEAGQELRKILRWLWDKAVKPILSELGYYSKSKKRYSNELPRLWWCASGIMSKLPFHAAGEGIESVNSENVYDYAVSSVTVSFTSLKIARGSIAPSEKVLNDGMLAVSMPTTPGRLALKAEEELESIQKAGGFIPTYLTNPRKVDVVKALSEYGIIHFICHGTSIAEDPSSSALILGDQKASAAEPLTVKELSTIGFGKARIAYLSACSTAENSSYKLSDESIHLAGAFQLAGFPHVIATFWEAKDRGAIPLAGLFYQNLARAVTELHTFKSNHDVVAYAFHDALCKVRQNKSTRNPLCWAPFVHIGA